MIQPAKKHEALLAEIEQTATDTPTLWWLGHAGFAVKFANITFYIDPCLTDVHARPRIMASPLAPECVRNADLILCTHAHELHMDPATLSAMLAASPHAKIVLPKSAADYARTVGIPFDRMTSTDADLRVEFFKQGLYGRIYAAPSAHPTLNWTPLGGYPCLGYLIRFGSYTIYHAGDCVPYDDLVARLKPYAVTAALLPIGGRNFEPAEAADLARQIEARWIAPMHYGTFEGGGDVNRFIDHMLGRHPDQRFKIFQCGEKWTIPKD
jgi:L-ascorbate metabolism protein UlaG (beta-lactamase superfamily)